MDETTAITDDLTLHDIATALRRPPGSQCCEQCSAVTFEDFTVDGGLIFSRSLLELLERVVHQTSPCPLCLMVLRSTNVAMDVSSLGSPISWYDQDYSSAEFHFHSFGLEMAFPHDPRRFAPLRITAERAGSGNFASLRVSCSISDPIIPKTKQVQYTYDYYSLVQSSSHGWLLAPTVNEPQLIEESALCVSTEYSDDAFENFQLREPLPLQNSDQAITLLRNWMRICVDEHPGCRAARQAEAPSRLIRVDHPGSRMRLVKTEGIPMAEGLKYSALSYCWGADGPYDYVTTSQTLQDRLNGIGLEALPKTIRDAIELTRRLGLSYLWVDALCILQGSDDAAKEDWDLESSRMAEIYGNAFITIAASRAKSVNDGILSPRVPLRGPKLDIPLNGGTQSVTLRQAHHFQPTESMNEPLYHRAWTLQERILSRRFLICNRDQYAWECQAASWTETGLNLASIGTLRLAQGTANFAPKELAELWLNIATDYTARELTNPKDKLPAIAGLARTFHERIQSSYLAGLWLSSLHDGLLWAHCEIGIGNIARRSTPSGYRAPSWSWASLNGNVRWPIERFPQTEDEQRKGVSRRRLGERPRVRWNGNHEGTAREMEERCGVLGYGVSPVSNDSFGAVNDGWLLLRGRLCRAHAMLQEQVRNGCKEVKWAAYHMGDSTTIYTDDAISSECQNLSTLPIKQLESNRDGICIHLDLCDYYPKIHCSVGSHTLEKILVFIDMMSPGELAKVDSWHVLKSLKDLWLFQITHRGFLLLSRAEEGGHFTIRNGQQTFKRVGIFCCQDSYECERLCEAVSKQGADTEITLV